MNRIRLVSGFLTVGFWTLASRILGFVRDIMIAAFLGSGPVAEAFFVAFSLPNMFRRFFAEGAFNSAFVPLFSKRLETGDDPEGFASRAFNVLGTILIVLSIIAIIAMPALVVAMASGFVGDDRFQLAVIFGRYAFIYILFIALGALLGGVLNASGRFAAAAGAPVLLNVALVGALVLADTGMLNGWSLAPGLEPDGTSFGSALIVGVVVAGVAQFVLLWVAVRRSGFRITLGWPRVSPDIRRLAIVAAPAALAAGVVQVNLLVGRQVASFFDGAIVWLSVADRLYQLPLGVVGIAIGIVLLPDLSRRLSSNDTEGARHAFNRSIEFSLALTVPAAVALIAIPVPLISTLFGRGAFGPDDVTATALVLAIYGAGLPAFVLQKVLQPLYFAREDTVSPFRFALVSMVVNAGLAIGLAPIIGYPAAAWGTTVAAWVMVWLLWRGSRRFGVAADLNPDLKVRIVRIVSASAIMGIVIVGLVYAFDSALYSKRVRYAAIVTVVASGIVTYFTVAHLIGALDLRELKKLLRRQR